MAAKGQYAAGTGVSKYRSLEEISSTLKRFGATGLAHAEDDTKVALMFVARGPDGGERRIRFLMLIPDREQLRPVRVNQSDVMYSRTPEQIEKLRQEEVNRLWRTLANGIKAKLAMVEDGIETLEEAFYAHILLPSGQTIYEETHMQIAEAYRTGQMPPLLPGLPAPSPVPALEGKG